MADKLVLLSLRVPAEMVPSIDAAAERRAISRGEFLRRAIARVLAGEPPPEEP